MNIKRLPIFPLPNVVLLPNMILPLHIFEERYRQMFYDILDGDRRFGIQLCKEYNPATLEGDPFDIGTIAEITDYEILSDGRINLVVVGRERYKVLVYDERSKPYRLGDVKLIRESKGGYIGKTLMTETSTLFHDAIRLTNKILGKTLDNTIILPEEPRELSFFIAEHLKGSLVLKQELLEMTSTKERLEYERNALDKMVRTLAVRTQIEEVFKNV